MEISKVTGCLLIATTVLTAACPAPAEAPAPDADLRYPIEENFRSASDRLLASGRSSVVSMIPALQKLYGVPISLEWPWEENDAFFFERQDVEFARGMRLRDALTEVGRMTQGYLRYERVSGVLVLVPGIPQSEEENPMVRRVSLGLDGVSTWEALVAIANAANTGYEHRIAVYPGSLVLYRKPPLQFTHDKSVSLHLSNVTVREAVCEVIAKSPLKMDYRASRYDRPPSHGPALAFTDLVIAFYEDGRRIPNNWSMSPDEMNYWDAMAKYLSGSKQDEPPPAPWSTAPEPVEPAEGEGEPGVAAQVPEEVQSEEPLLATEPDRVEDEPRTPWFPFVAGAGIIALLAIAASRRF